jgi:hypothetical protein
LTERARPGKRTVPNHHWVAGRDGSIRVQAQRAAISQPRATPWGTVSDGVGGLKEFWLNAQRAVDLWDAAKALKTQVERIKPLKVA